MDAFCCIGGATRGYQMLGAHVTGVDIASQPDYCGDEFIRADAVAFIAEHGHRFDFIHASPPCHGESAPTKGTNAARNARAGRAHPRLIAPARAVLERTGRPYVIENVPGSTVRKDVRLCGEMCGGGKATVAEIRAAKGIDWSSDHHALCEALPPAYTRHIGLAVAALLGGKAAA